MRKQYEIFMGIAAVLLIFTSACSVNTPFTVQRVNTPFSPEPTPEIQITPTAQASLLYLAPGLPADWVEAISSMDGLITSEDRESANLVFEPVKGERNSSPLFTATRVFSAAVPFFTIKDNLASDELIKIWHNTLSDEIYRFMVMDQDTYDLLSSVWGEASENVKVLAADALLDYCELNLTTLAILPFEAIAPRWKILSIDGISPLDKPMEVENYFLTVNFDLFSQAEHALSLDGIQQQFQVSIPVTNRDESKMTVVMMTGVTAITRVLAYKIKVNSLEYPIEAVKHWFVDADITHVSSETPLVDDCPVGDQFSSNLVFCTPTYMIEVLGLIGVDVVEMSGNHINDAGRESILHTFDVYNDHGWLFYAAGVDASAARSPVFLEHNGNRVAFIGCNAVGPESVFANEERPGGARCDMDYLTAKIEELKNQGYVVITTFQHAEVENTMYYEKLSLDFQLAAGAGSDIVQGSQAHRPMGFEFVGDNFIHYGLGNFLFDQMLDHQRQEFIDRHIIYDGEYINTVLLTANLVDWSKPTPMTEEQRVQLLDEMFRVSLRRKNENK